MNALLTVLAVVLMAPVVLLVGIAMGPAALVISATSAAGPRWTASLGASVTTFDAMKASTSP